MTTAALPSAPVSGWPTESQMFWHFTSFLFKYLSLSVVWVFLRCLSRFFSPLTIKKCYKWTFGTIRSNGETRAGDGSTGRVSLALPAVTHSVSLGGWALPSQEPATRAGLPTRSAHPHILELRSSWGPFKIMNMASEWLGNICLPMCEKFISTRIF